MSSRPHPSPSQSRPGSSSSGTSSSPAFQRRRASSSPRVAKRQDNTLPSSSHTQHVTRTICDSLWGQKLTFHPYKLGDSPVSFPALWPDRRTLVDTYKEPEVSKYPYELCKLLLATGSFKTLDALLDEQVGGYLW